MVGGGGWKKSRHRETTSSDSQEWEWIREERHTVGDPAKFRKGCEISRPLQNFLRNVSVVPCFRILEQPCKNNTGKTNKKQENEMKNKNEEIFLIKPKKKEK